MNYEKLEKALSIIVEEQDMKHYPVMTMALQRIEYLLDRFLVQLKDKEVSSA